VNGQRSVDKKTDALENTRQLLSANYKLSTVSLERKFWSGATIAEKLTSSCESVAASETLYPNQVFTAAKETPFLRTAVKSYLAE
jgi:hypothetical protein